MTTKKNNITTYISFILDKSGSMDSIRKDTIGGFNRYLKDLQKQKGKILFTLTIFDNYSKRLFTNMNVKEVKPLNEETYQPNSSTALYDAVVTTTEEVAKEVSKMEGKVKVLTVVLTDGEENASTKHDQNCFRDLIKELEAKDNYTFVYLGANQDSWDNASGVGYSRGNVADWSATSRGVQNAFMSLSVNTVAYSASSDMSVKSFNSLADKTKGGIK